MAPTAPTNKHVQKFRSGFQYAFVLFLVLAMQLPLLLTLGFSMPLVRMPSVALEIKTPTSAVVACFNDTGLCYGRCGWHQFKNCLLDGECFTVLPGDDFDAEVQEFCKPIAKLATSEGQQDETDVHAAHGAIDTTDSDAVSVAPIPTADARSVGVMRA